MLEHEYDTMYRLENTHWWFVAKKRYVQSVINNYLKQRGGNILDIGCGTGGMIDLLKNYGRVFGLDRHPAACEYSRQRNSFPLIKGDANRLPFKDGTFHLITLFDVLYHQHILEDEQVLSRIYDLLAPDGLILITDSAFDFLKSHHDIAVMARHRYTLKELKAKLVSCRFSIQKGSYLFFLIFPLVVLTRLAGKMTQGASKTISKSDVKETHPLLNGILAGLLSWEGKWLQHFNFPWGSSVLILGKKG